jgi:hypothetical protein
VVDGRKIAEDVTAQHMGVPVTVGLVNLDRTMCALALAVGKGMIDEPSFEDRLDHRTQRVVHQTIAEGRRRDKAPLGITHLDRHIAARAIAAVAKLALKPQQFAFEICIKGGGTGLLTLAEDGTLGSGVQRTEISDAACSAPKSAMPSNK